MKFCPVCNSEYSADDDFCPVDGSKLVLKLAGDPSRVVVSWDANPSDEVPTRYVSVPPRPGQAQTAPDNSKWLYALVGGLTAIVLMGGLYIFMMGQREKPPEGNGFQTSSSAGNIPGNKNAADNRDQTSVDPGFFTKAAPKPSNKPAVANTNTGPAVPLQQKFERSYTGEVDNHYFEMDLIRNGNFLDGEVRPNGRNLDMRVEGKVYNDETFEMKELSDANVVTGIYKGKFNTDGTVTGFWSKPGGERPAPFSLRRQ